MVVVDLLAMVVMGLHELVVLKMVVAILQEVAIAAL
jgi:hypothetical protein